MIQNWTHWNTYPALWKLPLDFIFLTCGYFTDSIDNTLIGNHIRLKRDTFVSVWLYFTYLLPLTASRDQRREDAGSYSKCFLPCRLHANQSHHFCVLGFFWKIKTKYVVSLFSSWRFSLSFFFFFQYIHKWWTRLLFALNGTIIRQSYNTVFSVGWHIWPKQPTVKTGRLLSVIQEQKGKVISFMYSPICPSVLKHTT